MSQFHEAVARPYRGRVTAVSAPDPFVHMIVDIASASTTTNRVALLGDGALEQTQLQLGQVLVDRCRQMGERSQFLNTWTVGDPSLAFGLYRPGD